MTDEVFDKLPGRLQLAYVLGFASDLLGRDLVARLYRNMRPLADDVVGHGWVFGMGDGPVPPDPAGNYWGGAWQVYDAE